MAEAPATGGGGGPSKARAIWPIVILLMAIALPTAPYWTRGMVTFTVWLQTILQIDVIFLSILYPFLILRIVSSLWIYFKLDNVWTNEVGYMAIFLVSPLIGFVVYLIYKDRINKPPAGYEYAEIRDGIVHQPVFEYEAPTPPLESVPPERPPGPPEHEWEEVALPPRGNQLPPPEDPSQRPTYPEEYYYGRPPPAYAQMGYGGRPPPAGYGPQPYAQQPHPGTTHYPQAPLHPHTPWMQQQQAPMYGAPLAAPATAAGHPYIQRPGPGWKKVGEKLVQKRDYLAWYNPLLLIFAAMTLSGYVQLLFIGPILAAALENGPDQVDLESIFSPGFVFVTILIQDAILVWMVWHQVVRRRVIPFGEMGMAREQLRDTGRVARLSVMGVLIGLVLFTIAFAIEQGQAALGFAPDAEGVIGPQVGDTQGYVIWLMSTVIVAPLAEELFFRGYAFYAFNKRLGLHMAIFLSAFGFAVIHTNIYALAPIFVAGVGLALAYHWSGSLVPPIIAHAVNNFIAVTLLYTGFYN